MSSAPHRFRRPLRRLPIPILAILAGMGFVVQGIGLGAPEAGGAAGAPSLSAGHPQEGSGLVRSGGSSSLLAFDVLTLESAARRGGGGREDHAGRDDAVLLGGPALRVPSSHRLTKPAAGATAPSTWTRGALERAGRLSAPSTAPPTSSL